MIVGDAVYRGVTDEQKEAVQRLRGSLAVVELTIAAGMRLAVAAHCGCGLSIARPDSQLEDGGGGLHIFCRDRNLYPSGCGSTGTDYYYGSMRCVMETSGGYFLVQFSLTNGNRLHRNWFGFLRV